MKTSKHIEKLTRQWAKEDGRTKDSIECYKTTLQNILNALLKGKFYIRVEKVSHSGMSRTIKMAYMLGHDLCFIRSPFLLKLAGCDKNGRITGCGMDMLYHAQYNLFCNLHSNYKRANYSKRMKPYKNF